jgi:hypothetical protein
MTKVVKTKDGVKGARWAFMTVLRIRARFEDDVYLTRLRIVQTPLFGLYLHRISGPDPDTYMHDHPWNFWSLVLRGGYTEQVPEAQGMAPWRYKHEVKRRLSYKRAEDLHAIRRLHRNPTWTLLLVGRRRREWGFYTNAGWVQWDKYITSIDSREHKEGDQ